MIVRKLGAKNVVGAFFVVVSFSQALSMKGSDLSVDISKREQHGKSKLLHLLNPLKVGSTMIANAATNGKLYFTKITNDQSKTQSRKDIILNPSVVELIALKIAPYCGVEVNEKIRRMVHATAVYSLIFDWFDGPGDRSQSWSKTLLRHAGYYIGEEITDALCKSDKAQRIYEKFRDYKIGGRQPIKWFFEGCDKYPNAFCKRIFGRDARLLARDLGVYFACKGIENKIACDMQPKLLQKRKKLDKTMISDLQVQNDTLQQNVLKVTEEQKAFAELDKLAPEAR